MIIARFNATDYKLEQRPVLTFSASETTFSEIVIDFTGKTAADLPIKYQEIQVVDTGTPDVVLYYGYCSQPSLPAFNGTIQRVLLTIELMSPQTYLTKRTIDILIKNDNIHTAVDNILAGIVAHDGFTIESNDLPTTEYLSGIFQFRTIESLLSELAGRFNFIWYVDELKKIYIKYLPNIETSTAVYNLTSPTQTDLASVQPYFNVSDYANRLNFTNVNLIGWETLLAGAGKTTLRTGETYNFIYPFSLSDGVLYRIDPADPVDTFSHALLMYIDVLGEFKIYVDLAAKTTTIDSTIGFSGDDETGKFLILQRDGENPNLITGIKYLDPADHTVSYCLSASALKPTTMSYIDPVEISQNAGKINTSGIIEKEYNANGKYYTYSEMTAFAKSLLNQNNKQADTVEIRFSGDDLTALKAILTPTAKVYIDLPSQFIDANDYVIISGEYIIGQGKYDLSVQCQKASLTENYVDIFRRESTEQQGVSTQFITYYNQDEKTIISHKVIVDGEEVDV